MGGMENKPRRRTSTSVSPANGSLDLASDRETNSSHHDAEPDFIKHSSNSSMQQCSAFSTILVLTSLLLFVFYVSAGRWKGARSQIGDFLGEKTDDPEGMPSLGIVLHPESHRSRNASIITLHWTITSDFRAPDGVKKRVYLINGNKRVSYHLKSLSPSLKLEQHLCDWALNGVDGPAIVESSGCANHS
jgi:hypothetical protein